MLLVAALAAVAASVGDANTQVPPSTAVTHAKLAATATVLIVSGVRLNSPADLEALNAQSRLIEVRSQDGTTIQIGVAELE